MLLLSVLLVMTVVGCVVVAFKPRCVLWSLVTGVVLLCFSFLTSLSYLSLLLLWGVYVLISLFLLVKPLRLRVLTPILFVIYKKQTLKMSRTEREALEAGDSWWEKEIFQGSPQWSSFSKIQLAQLSEEERQFCDTETLQLCEKINGWEVDYVNHALSSEVLDIIRQQGFLGLQIHKEYQGKGFSALANSRVNLRLNSKSAIAATIVMVCNSLGPGELIAYYGTDEQKTHYLPRLAKGTDIPCFGLTGPLAGSDAANTPDRGVVCYGDHQGEQVLGLRLTFFKRYITLSPIATVIGLAIRVVDPDHLLGDQVDLGITCCLVPADYDGVEIGHRHWPHGAPWYNGPIRGKEIFIPMDWIIGGQARIGQGWKMLNDCLAVGRAVSLPTLATTQMILSYLTSSAYTTVREQFNVPIAKMDGVRAVLAQIGGLTYLADATLRFTITAVDQGLKPSVASAISKYHLTEQARVVVNHAIDIHGGKGLQDGPRNYLSPLYDSVPIGVTVEGANILTRNLIIFGQGSIRCHPFAFDEVQVGSIKDERQALLALDGLVYQHIGYFLRNAVRAVWRGVTGGRMVKVPRRSLKRYYQKISRLSAAFSLTAEVAMMTLGGELKRKERLSARLGDVMSYLYMASAVLKYYEHDGEPESERPMAEWALSYCLTQAEQALLSFYRNFPRRGLGVVAKRLCFPWGAHEKLPNDVLENKVTEYMLGDNALRERFLDYFSFSKTDVYGQLEEARRCVLATQALRQRLRKAVKSGQLDKLATLEEQIDKAVSLDLLTDDEAQQLREAERYRWEVIQVDEFNADLSTVMNPLDD